MTTTTLFVLILLPCLWGFGLSGLNRVIGKHLGPPDDRTEKRDLWLLLAPFAVGLTILTVAAFVPDLPVQALPADLFAPPPPTASVSPPDASSGFDLTALRNVHLWSGLCLTVFAAGVLVNGVRLLAGVWRLRRLAAAAVLTQIGDTLVRVTPAAVPAFAWGREDILLPQSLLDTLSERDLAMVIAHEREHLRRGDPVWFLWLSAIDTLLWFNPVVRRQTGRCRMAAELACDAAVTAEAPTMREAYARLLVRLLRHTAGDVRQYAPAVFSPNRSGDYRMRMSEIMHASPPVRKRRHDWRYGLIAALIAMPVVYGQLAVAQGPTIAHTSSDKRLAEIKAVADGQVVRADITEVQGSTAPNIAVQIDHGDGILSTYLLAGTTSLKPGDRVRAGQSLSKTGLHQQTSVNISKVKDDKAAAYMIAADSLTGFAETKQFIASGNAHLTVGKRRIEADLIFSDPRNELAIAEGHVRIVNL